MAEALSMDPAAALSASDSARDQLRDRAGRPTERPAETPADENTPVQPGDVVKVGVAPVPAD